MRNRDYPWLQSYVAKNCLAARIAPPGTATRVPVRRGSIAEWLRFLPLLEGRPPVLLYNGREKNNQTAQHAVVELDVGRRNLQQCADAVIRLRAEYLYSRGLDRRIKFRYTSGDWVGFSRRQRGERPVVRGNHVS
jgi:hypothetical protein